ncbi:MAG: NADH-quinone oxidoreductase subunit M [Verrucomicrobiota bacterium]|nr:NADH-quinone oxidoreductase subunit M [Verrucomicrobiota bacterium]
MTFDQLLLLGAIIVPAALGIIILVFFMNDHTRAKRLAWIAFTFPFIAGIFLFAGFDPYNDGYSYEILFDRMGLQALGITFHLGLNGVSAPLFAMAGIVGFSAGFAAIKSQADRISLYLGLLAFMQAGLMGLFASVDIFFYYLFHEFALIPTFIMIGLWGGRDRRSVALEITIYLTLGALISLGGLVALNVLVDAPKFDFPSLSEAILSDGLGVGTQKKIFALLLFGFGILVALFPFHTWAPRGYEAAPTSVSMLHAGVLKKFGLYGLVQLAIPLLPAGGISWGPFLLWLALGNIIIVGAITISQSNLKSMIGNGSVMHMGYCFLGLGVCSSLGASATVMLMCAHGLSVSLMFLLANFIYKRSGSLEMDEIGGLAKQTPMLACFFAAATFATIGLPGFGNFWGEFAIFLSLGEYTDNYIILFLAALGIILSAIFGLRAMSRIFFGAKTDELLAFEKKNSINDLKPFEIIPTVVIVVPLLFIGLWPRGISEGIDTSVSSRFQSLENPKSNFGLPDCCPVDEVLVNGKKGVSTGNTSNKENMEDGK